MAQQQALLLYDFEGDTESGELSVREGDKVTVLNKAVGDGWWEVQIGDQIGLVPESYCQVEGEEDGGMGMNHDEGNPDEDWQEDDWDDNDPEESVRSKAVGNSVETEATNDQASSGGQRSVSPGQQSGSIAGRHGTVKKNINRFSPFVKTGTEGFILGSVSVRRAITDQTVKVVQSEDGSPMWEPNPNPYSVNVSNPQKKSKFKGIKSFIAYEITTSNGDRPVSRRYKHYDWLHERLAIKFAFFSVPPLPDKQYYGRYGEDFVEKRREKLQMWTNRIARHPVISRSDVFHHFLACPDEKEWKAGKRKAEKDEVTNGALYLTLEHTMTSEISEAEKTVEHFSIFLQSMEESLTKMKAKFIDHCNKMSGPFMAEHHRMAAVITGLGHCFEMVNKEYSMPLTRAINYTADMYKQIGDLYNNQPKYDMLPAMDVLKEYLGLIQEFPDVHDIHKGAASKVRDCERMKEEGRIDFMEASDITARSEKVSSIVLAEVYHFQRERVVDFREMMKAMLQAQINFYKEITGKLESALSGFDESTDL
ncbi:PREDICTED: sorting nexin-33-like [Amphimedon queenslandica]|uniref:Sorting nexin n=1 Tax=Amphimedon queenslandica TaxID=400682 RepID=A0A1X7VVQ9_AMPQE|nr:PREDICTED: sorting nexin-33-like [Amphimedon queenslandica]|eukprot:XP_003382576.1 PREDICTED: sorting nexin-33-like [Amphimedon queenslandica]